MVPLRSREEVADCVDAADDVSAGVGGVGLADIGQCLRVAEDGNGLFELGEIRRADHDGRITPVAGDDDALVLVFHGAHPRRSSVCAHWGQTRPAAARFAGGPVTAPGPIEWTATSSPSANHAHSS